MHNYYAIETEADFRRQEWQRAALADCLASQALARGLHLRLPRLPHFTFAKLRSFAGTRLPLAGSLAPQRHAVAVSKLSDC